jgi:excisionase family DNA binding protein
MLVMASNAQDEQFFGVEQAARTVGLSYWTVLRWIRIGRLTRYKVGSRIVVRLDELRELLKPKKETE